jgi:hypothetical protein
MWTNAHRAHSPRRVCRRGLVRTDRTSRASTITIIQNKIAVTEASFPREQIVLAEFPQNKI